MLTQLRVRHSTRFRCLHRLRNRSCPRLSLEADQQIAFKWLTPMNKQIQWINVIKQWNSVSQKRSSPLLGNRVLTISSLISISLIWRKLSKHKPLKWVFKCLNPAVFLLCIEMPASWIRHLSKLGLILVLEAQEPKRLRFNGTRLPMTT